VFDLAAADAFGVIADQPFIDGNKRTGFPAAYVFLDLNGWELSEAEAEAATAVTALAKGETDGEGFSEWLIPSRVQN